MNHTQATQRSASDFEAVVLPQIKVWLPDCRYYSFETLKDKADPVSREIFTLMDDKCGADGMFYHTTYQSVKFVGIRVQRKNVDYSTFTIRSERGTGTKTEYQKRVESIQRGELIPHFTIQAYLSFSGQLMSVGLCYTQDLFNYLANGGVYTSRYVREFGGSWFKAVKWSDFRAAKYNIWEYHASLQDLYC